MKKIILFTLLVLGTCFSLLSWKNANLQLTPVPSPRATGISYLAQIATPTPWASETFTPAYVTPTETPNALVWAQVTMIFANATDTQVSIGKTESAIRDARGTQAAVNQQIAIQSTNVAGMTQVASTAQATHTQIAATETALVLATQQAATQRVQAAKLAATTASVWLSFCMLAGLGGFGLAWVALRLHGTYKRQQAEYLQNSAIRPDSMGRRPSVPLDAVKGGAMLNLDLQHRALSLDDMTVEQAMLNAHDQRTLEGTRALAAARVKRLTDAKEPATTQPASIVAPSGLLDAGPLPPPTWSMIENWSGDGIPYGVSARGIETMSPETFPHLGVFGRTGTGKSRLFLRAFVACSLAAGNSVVILGKAVDFQPFSGHVNAKVLPFRSMQDPNEAGRYAACLKAFVEEMSRREAWLVTHGASTWQRAGRPSTTFVLDEVWNAMLLMPREIQGNVFRLITALVNEGRKNGMNIVIAAQRAVGFKPIVSQMGRVSFAVDDSHESRYAIGFEGAENLQRGEFYSRFGMVHRCAAFDPSDAELREYLLRHPVQERGESLAWVDAVATDSMETAPSETEQLAERIRGQWSPELSKRKTAELLGMTYAGAATVKIDAVIRHLIATTTPQRAETRPLPA